jgi:ABC-2 type transport system permease protein
MAELAQTARAATARRPSVFSRVYGLGSVFGKSLRDARWAIVGVGLVVGVLIVGTASQIGDQFGTIEARRALAAQMEILPVLFRGLLGEPINVETLPGFISWRLVGFLPLMVGIWSIVALSSTLAGEASRGTLELVLSMPLSRRALAFQKLLAHIVALVLAMAIVAVFAWLAGVLFGTLPGDQAPLTVALSEFALVAAMSLFAGAVAFALAPILGRGKAAGVAGAVLFGSYAVNGYADIVPGFDIARLASVFYWTENHRPMAGVSDWPAVGLVVAMVAALGLVGVVLFQRRDLASTVVLPVPRVGLGGRGGRWSLAGVGVRSFGERLPDAIGWGIGLGFYGVFIALSADAFARTLTSVPEIAEMVRRFYPGLDFTTAGGVLQLAMFTFVAMIIGLAAASLVSGWSSDEREGRLEMVLATPVRRVSWALRSGASVLGAVMLLAAIMGAMTALAAASQGGGAMDVFAGALILGLYGAALAGIGLAVGGLGWPRLAGPTVVGLALGFYLLDFLGGVLQLPSEILDLALQRHLGQPMAGIYDALGMLACAALAIGGLLVGAWGFTRRDLQGR